MVNYINTAPLYEMWRRTVHQPDWRVIEETPSVLCRMLYTDDLDVGLVSSHEYALHAPQYRVLSDLSISASGRVGSVFLFSRFQPEDLDGRSVVLSNQSQTSSSLVRIVLKEFYNATPEFRSGDVLAWAAEPGPPGAVLAIGDDALRLRESNRFPVVLDLGEIWQHHTGLPFVFALWVVREDFYQKQPDTVSAIHRELLRCVSLGRAELAEVSRRVAPRIPMDPEQCFRYLQGIEYDLSPAKKKALERFFTYLIGRNEVDESALPLKILEARG